MQTSQFSKRESPAAPAVATAMGVSPHSAQSPSIEDAIVSPQPSTPSSHITPSAAVAPSVDFLAPPPPAAAIGPPDQSYHTSLI
jgi:hypothetical protein